MALLRIKTRSLRGSHTDAAARQSRRPACHHALNTTQYSCLHLAFLHKGNKKTHEVWRGTLRSLMGTQGQFQKPCWASICLSS